VKVIGPRTALGSMRFSCPFFGPYCLMLPLAWSRPLARSRRFPVRRRWFLWRRL